MKERVILHCSIAILFLAHQSAGNAQPAISAQFSDTFELRTSDGAALPVPESITSEFDLVFAEVGARLGASREDFSVASWQSSLMAQQSAELAAVLTGARGPNITVTFRVPGPESCRVRGAAAPIPGSPAIQIFADRDTPPTQIFGVLAHELGHLFQWLVIAKGSNGFGLFNEGFASWAAGSRWAAMIDMPSLQFAVATYIEEGKYIPLLETGELRETIYPGTVSMDTLDCLARRDLMYTEWGAFIEYLVSEFGRETIYEFVRASTTASADPSEPTDQYAMYFGQTLEQLESAWLDTLSRYDQAR